MEAVARKVCHLRPPSGKNLLSSSQSGSYLTGSSRWPSEPTPLSSTTMLFLHSPGSWPFLPRAELSQRESFARKLPVELTLSDEPRVLRLCLTYPASFPFLSSSHQVCTVAQWLFLISPASSFVPGCLLRWRPMIPASWHLCVYVTISPWISARPSDSLLINRNQQQGWAVTLEIRLPKTGTLVLLALSRFLSHLFNPMR